MAFVFEGKVYCNVEKAENAACQHYDLLTLYLIVYEQFLLYPQCFQKLYVVDALK